MREHMGLYRGKRKDNGEWVEGFYAHLKDLYKNRETHRIYTPFAENDCGEFYPDWYPVDPDTVGECTGLKDKNGKLIWEGNIISIRFESDYEPPSAPDVWYEYAKIIWSETYHAWHAVFGDGYECSLWEYDGVDDVVVCGDIHDNPELLIGGEGE